MFKIMVILLAAAGAQRAQDSGSCCQCEPRPLHAAQKVDVICLSPKEMRSRVDHIEPLRPSGLGTGVNLVGEIVMEVRFGTDGKVACARARSGHPIAISAAMEAIQDWTFKPLRLNGVSKTGCGRVTINYRLKDRGSTTKVAGHRNGRRSRWTQAGHGWKRQDPQTDSPKEPN